MRLLTVAKIALVMSLFINALAFAKNNDDKVACPSITTLRKAAQKIDDVMKLGSYYVAMTTKPAFKESNLSWIVMIGNISAPSCEDALQKAQETIAKTSIQKEAFVYLDKEENVFTCNYGPGDIKAVAGDITGGP